MQMFAAYLDDGAREELQAFARGKNNEVSPMYLRIIDAFDDLSESPQTGEGILVYVIATVAVIAGGTLIILNRKREGYE